MSLDLFTCENCGGAHTAYDRFICENEHELCSYCLPDYFSEIGCSDDIYGKCNQNFSTDKDLQAYIGKNDDLGYFLKKEYCPVCQKKEKHKDDPQYKEYLRLKTIYGGIE